MYCQKLQEILKNWNLLSGFWRIYWSLRRPRIWTEREFLNLHLIYIILLKVWTVKSKSKKEIVKKVLILWILKGKIIRIGSFKALLILMMRMIIWARVKIKRIRDIREVRILVIERRERMLNFIIERWIIYYKKWMIWIRKIRKIICRWVSILIKLRKGF